MDLSRYTLATLHQDSKFVLCRGLPAESPIPDLPSVLVTMPASEHPAADRVRMLEHELAFQAELDSTWAVHIESILREVLSTDSVLIGPNGT
jgi:hypothetical protein